MTKVKKRFLVVFLVLRLGLTMAKVAGVVGEKIYDCEEIPKNKRTNAADYSNLKIHQENDTHAYLNGSIDFSVGFVRLPGRVYLEQYVRGKWIIQIYDRTFFDMCFSFRNPTEIFYNQTKHFPNCPIKSDTQWNFDMIHLKASDDLRENFPTYLIGLWRVSIIMEFLVGKEYKKNCKRIHCDIYEV